MSEELFLIEYEAHKIGANYGSTHRRLCGTFEKCIGYLEEVCDREQSNNPILDRRVGTLRFSSREYDFSYTICQLQIL